MKRIDRAVKRYGPSAVAKYYSAPSSFRPEMKYFDTMFSYTIDDSGGTFSPVTCTSYLNADGSTISAYTDAALIPSAIGSGYGQVVGNKYLLKKLKIRGTVTIDSLAGVVGYEGDMIRILLMQDTQPNGAQHNGANIFTNWGTSLQDINSFQNISAGEGGRFRVLGDKFIPIEPIYNGSTNTAFMKKQFSFTKTWKKGLKVVVKSGASTPAVASLSDCNIFMLAYAASAISTLVPKMHGCARAVFTD